MGIALAVQICIIVVGTLPKIMRFGRVIRVGDVPSIAYFFYKRKELDMKYTREDIEKVLDEMERRIHCEFGEIGVHKDAPKIMHRIVCDKLDGMYSTFVALADDWPSTRMLINECVEERWLLNL